jgi:hypothetical protein
VNKYSGDNIMVIWGAPIEVADEARAVNAHSRCEVVPDRRAKAVGLVASASTPDTSSPASSGDGSDGYTVGGGQRRIAPPPTSRRDQVACSAETLGELGDDVDYVDPGDHVKGRAGRGLFQSSASGAHLRTPRPR